MKKYNANSGWFKESQRHSLARLGVKTGRRQSYDYARPITVKYEEPSFLDIADVSTPVPEDKDVMEDADDIVAGSEEQRFVEPEETQEVQVPEEIEIPEEAILQESELAKSISDDLNEFESQQEASIIGQTWGQRVKSKISDLFGDAVSALRDKDSVAVQEHMDGITHERDTIQDRINILADLKRDILSKEYKKEAGLAKQLQQVDRVNKLLQEPLRVLDSANATIASLQSRKQSFLKAGVKPVEGRSESAFGFGDLFHPFRTLEMIDSEVKGSGRKEKGFFQSIFDETR